MALVGQEAQLDFTRTRCFEQLAHALGKLLRHKLVLIPMHDAGGQRHELFHPLIKIGCDVLGAAVSDPTCMRGCDGEVIRMRGRPDLGAVVPML